MMRARARRGIAVLLSAVVLLAAGCTTVAPRPGVDANIDPWENWNRKVFAFNDSLDENLLQPVARTYVRALPQPVRHGVGNFFQNFRDGWSAINNFLQGRPGPGMRDVVRFSTNTFLGFGGVLDLASEMGLDPQNRDLGQTLATWGFGAGPYMVLPVFGSSTVRETIALPVDHRASPAYLVHDLPARYGLLGLDVVNRRGELLGASRLLEDIALDKYSFVRDAYLQRRRSLLLGDQDDDDFQYAPADDDVPDAPPAPAASAPSASQPPP